MLEAVQERLENEHKSLDRLGKARPDVSDQRAYLVSIAERFQTLANKALTSPEDLPWEEMKLRGKAERAKRDFAEKLRVHGHLYKFVDPRETGATSNTKRASTPSDAVGKSGQTTKSDLKIYDEIKSQIEANRSKELPGMINPAVLKPLLQKQASEWPKLAEEHLQSLVLLTNETVRHILEETCRELAVAEYTQEQLIRIVVNFATEARKKALQRLANAWEYEVLHLQTENPAFITKVTEAQELRFAKAIERYVVKHPTRNFLAPLFNKPETVEAVSHLWGDWVIVNMATLRAFFAELHSHTEQNTEDEIHDLLQAYYMVRGEHDPYLVHIIPFDSNWDPL
jgi:hypothetical protein